MDQRTEIRASSSRRERFSATLPDVRCLFMAEEKTLVGGCLCGGIRYEYDGAIEEISMCHCSMCRKAQGSAFVAVSPIDAAKFRIVRGAELLREYRAVREKARAFCSNCGSPIYSARDDLPGIKRLRLGTLETPFECDVAYHIYVDDKAPWEPLADTLPRYGQSRPRQT